MKIRSVSGLLGVALAVVMFGIITEMPNLSLSKHGNDPMYIIVTDGWLPKEMEVTVKYTVGEGENTQYAVNVPQGHRSWQREIEFEPGKSIHMRVTPRFDQPRGGTQIGCEIRRNGSRVASMSVSHRAAASCNTVMR